MMLWFKLLFFIFLAFQEQVSAAKKSYIVYLGGHSHGPDVTSDHLDAVTNFHHELLGSFLESKEEARDAIFYSYQRHINGFAAVLDEEVAERIAKHPDVVSVFLNEDIQLQTTQSWDFLGLVNHDGKVGVDDDGTTDHHQSLWEKANFGKDIIIANLDTGVWPESRSFSDEGFGPIPSKWKGSCKNSNITCNRKLIGAAYFNKGMRALLAHYGTDLLNNNTARDDIGHGSHTLSTAGGNFVNGANLLGNANGTAKGGSPKARVAAYRVCWTYELFGLIRTSCAFADILKGFDMAIHDGVDVISISIGGSGSKPYFESVLAIGAFHALMKNVMVTCSAGNLDVSATSVDNLPPWVITVGASTIDRDFQAVLNLFNGLHFQGRTLSEAFHEKKFYPLVLGSEANTANSSTEDAKQCLEGTLDREKVHGKILVCVVGEDIFRYDLELETGRQAALAGAVGMILCNDRQTGNRTRAYKHYLPAINIGYGDGLSLLSYMNSTNDPRGYIQEATLLGAKPSPVIAYFSLTGPNTLTPDILKPDIVAPGVNILAAYSEQGCLSDDLNDKRSTSFNLLSGTSMAAPHVAGIVGLLKTLYPDWSPAAIRSAIMTTAQTKDNTGNGFMVEGGYEKATPFHYGAGHVQPNSAMDPGLIYDLTVKDHLDFLCAIGYNQTMIRKLYHRTYECPKNFSLNDYNYPSITVSNLQVPTPTTVTRRVKNVGGPGIYNAHLRQPPGVSVIVEPSSLKFERVGEEKSFKLMLEAKNQTEGYVFGELLWSDGHHNVHSPLVVRSFS